MTAGIGEIVHESLKLGSNEYYNYLKKASNKTNINYWPEPSVNRWTLKMDIEMAKAMSEGYIDDGVNVFPCIMSSHSNSIALQNEFEKYPKLITYSNINNTNERTYIPVNNPNESRPLSKIGFNIKKDIISKIKSGIIPFKYKYLASLVSIYHIRNDIKVWDDICNSGLFDIWSPTAPFSNIYGKKDPIILLIRVYELENEYPHKHIDFKASPYFGKLMGDTVFENIKPVIDNDNFLNKTKKLDTILLKNDALRYKEIFLNEEATEDYEEGYYVKNLHVTI
ncbi:hypothetical protein Metev_0152 [Methanohalobium evestigatum Z-7303]|uniref:Uncharacterized protein n=1 Tax=Methanohalobium evestigatum (strain ATCC BAA-1072 / DSM 3721 / NBRC 107634 / OCM 161 / Z-7303) TaxID=644295 RepID=D7E661_METEZ|nr:hypothetical protein [Methanohalobium evestigatum]ADI73083.1 hypothetical protein Metev_0152 [Methanohalobium evestigatum Z-7303]